MSNGEYIMNAVDLFMWIVIGGAVSIVFVMFLWSVNALAKMMRIGRKILRMKHKRRRRAAVRKKVIDLRNKTKTEQKLNTIGELDDMVRQPVRESAKKWFRRPPYDIQRGDSGGQKDSK